MPTHTHTRHLVGDFDILGVGRGGALPLQNEMVEGHMPPRTYSAVRLFRVGFPYFLTVFHENKHTYQRTLLRVLKL